MQYATKDAICFGDLKQAALYFERVLPFGFRRLYGQGPGKDVVLEIPEAVPGRALVNVMFGSSPKDQEEKWRLLGSYLDALQGFARATTPVRVGGPKVSDVDDYRDLKEAYLSDGSSDAGLRIRSAFQKLSGNLGITNAAVVLDDQDHFGTEWTYPTLSLHGVPMIDTSSTDWEQIIEIRNDAEARRRLRNLRLFLTDTYTGKDRAYVEDDLLRRLDDYDAAHKQLGLKSTIGTLSLLLDAKTLQATAAAGVAGAIFGGPIGAAVAAGAVEIGKVSLEFAETRAAIKEFERGHPMAYVVEARRSLKA
jgi:hypothetical protein